MNKLQAIGLCCDFLNSILEKEDWFIKTKPSIAAILLYGSTARGTNRPDSDIDILIFMPLALEKKFTRGEYFYNFKNVEFNIVIRSLERLRELAADNYNQKEADVFEGCVMLAQTNNEVGKLIGRIIKN